MHQNSQETADYDSSEGSEFRFNPYHIIYADHQRIGKGISMEASLIMSWLAIIVSGQRKVRFGTSVLATPALECLD